MKKTIMHDGKPLVADGRIVQVDVPDAAADLTLGLTAAQPGQIARITAVDASGAPTAWEPVDMPQGGGEVENEEFIQTIPMSPDVENYVLADIFRYRKVRFIINKIYKKIGTGNPFLTVTGNNGFHYAFSVGSEPIQYKTSEHVFERSSNGRLDYSEWHSNNNIILVSQQIAISNYVNPDTKFDKLTLNIPASFLAELPEDAHIDVYGVRA